MEKTIIGILAGMGPRSTAPFVDAVIDEAQKQYGAKYDIDFPHMLIYSLPTPFYLDREIDDEDMIEALVFGLKQLEKSGVSFISMPCNTAHAYFTDLQNSISVPLINMVEESLKNISTGNGPVTVLATPSTMQSQVYQKGIKEKHVPYVFEEQWQESINQIIKLIKAGKTSEAQTDWNKLIERIHSASISNAIIACTDLNALDLNNTFVKFVDSGATLAQATIEKYLEFRKN